MDQGLQPRQLFRRHLGGDAGATDAALDDAAGKQGFKIALH